MRSFVVQNIDSLVQVILGLFVCFHAYGKASARGVASASRPNIRILLRIGGPFLIAIGLVQIFFHTLAVPDWKRYSTSDGIASVEFPAVPDTQQNMDSANGVSVPRTSLVCDMRSKGINVILSFSPILDGKQRISDDERIAAMKEYLAHQGMTLTREAKIPLGAVSGFALECQGDGGKSRVWMRVALTNGGVYRVVVASSRGNHDDATIARCLNSFRIEAETEKR
jgi:hypothetical protein